MGKIKSPETYSSHFGVPASELARVGALDVTLAVDTKLFIDPLLLEKSRVKEIAREGRAEFERYFAVLIKLLRKGKRGGAAWRKAAEMLRVEEIPGTCLGYGNSSIRGSTLGQDIAEQLLETAAEIVELGVEDPDLFAVIPLIERGIAADGISDLATRAILPSLLAWNVKLYKRKKFASVKRRGFVIADCQAELPENPLTPEIPVILVPKDVLRELPLAKDWSGIGDAIDFNRALRHKVNRLLGGVWESSARGRGRRGRKRPSKEELRQLLREQALASKEHFECLLAAVQSQQKIPYDVELDPKGLRSWAQDGGRFAAENPLDLECPKTWTADAVAEVVERILEQYEFLIEERGLWRTLWNGTKPLPERSAQLLFFAIAFGYCKANNLDLTPEADTGTGVVDFKVSAGFDSRVLVELKLSSNSRLVHGYERQLEAYRKSEETSKAWFVVIDVGGMGKKLDRIEAAERLAERRGEPLSEVWVIDASPRRSASKR